MILTAILQSDPSSVVAEAVPVQEELSFSLIDMAIKGGWLMIPLFLLSILTIYIFAQKWWDIRKASVIDENFMKDIRDYIHQGKSMQRFRCARRMTRLFPDS